MPTGENRKSLGPLAVAGVAPYQEKPGEEYMNDQQKAHFRKILGAWRNQLMQEVDRTVDHMKDEAANFPDPVDRAATRACRCRHGGPVHPRWRSTDSRRHHGPVP